MNAKKELLEHVAYLGKTLLAAEITVRNCWGGFDEEPEAQATLYPEHIKLEDPMKALAIEEFTSAIDVKYDAGFGGQELFGTLWFTDGTYSDRYEYDGSECWNHHATPKLPQQPKMEVNHD